MSLHACRSHRQLLWKRYTLQHTAKQCSRPATHCNNPATHYKTLQHTTTHCKTHCKISGIHCNNPVSHCNTLQHIATHCNTQHHTITPYNTLHLRLQPKRDRAAAPSASQHAATHRNTPQHTASHHNHTTTTPHHTTPQHTATHCNKLHLRMGAQRESAATRRSDACAASATDDNFSKVSALLNYLLEMTFDLTFENFHESR